MDFETRAIHEGQEPDPATGAVITPIYQTATYVQEEVGRHKGYDYSRVANPTRTAHPGMDAGGVDMRAYRRDRGRSTGVPCAARDALTVAGGGTSARC